MILRLAAICVALAGFWPAGGAAQTMGGPFNEGVIQSPILVIDFERVFAQSAFGQRLQEEIEREGNAIAAENRRIEAELIEEERRLTEQRPTMPPEEFRALADAFDEKVQRLRSEQDAKARALNSRNDEARRQFLTLAQPVLEQLLRETGALLILERRAVFVAADAVDVSDRAIALIDDQIGAGDDVMPDFDAPPDPPPQDPSDSDVPAPPVLDPGGE